MQTTRTGRRDPKALGGMDVDTEWDSDSEEPQPGSEDDSSDLMVYAEYPGDYVPHSDEDTDDSILHDEDSDETSSEDDDDYSANLSRKDNATRVAASEISLINR